jgi:hypothetical protein
MPSFGVKKLMTCPNPKLTDLADHDAERQQSMSPRETSGTRHSAEAREIVVVRAIDSVGRIGRMDCDTLIMPGSRGVEDRENLGKRVDLG